MTLSPGARLGPYEVTALIGEGGMGKVWRAHHTALKRDDALKVLPDAFASDPERLARFRREAQVLASLNHPNIAHVYGLEQSDGVQALVMELVEGPTLADRIAQGPIPIDEALPIAKQIAEALEAAHEQSIIHRDLKPANIKLRPDGTVKVLDFGLAKALEPVSAANLNATASPTITSPALMTGVGVLLGTAAYMSPEQARGKVVDKRSDIWAFGCVLYEMLTGKRAFDDSNVSDTLASVLKSEPDWSALGPDVPVAVRTLLERCLVKDQRERVADITVAKFVLREARGLSMPQGAAVGAAVVLSRTSRWRSAAAAGGLALAAAALAGVVTWSLTPSVPVPPVTRFSFAVPQDHQLVSGLRAVAVSPDGRQLVYAGLRQLYLRSVSEWESHAIAGTDVGQLQNPVFSPDGASVAFSSGGAIHRIAVNGGVAVPVCQAGVIRSMTWDASGIVFGGRGGIFRCSPNGGMPEQLATVGNDEEAYGPQILPSGQAMIFTIAKASDAAERWDNAQIVVQSLPSGERRTLLNGGSDARYLPTGHLLYSVRGIVLAVRFDPVRQELLGGAVPVIDGVRRALNGASGATHFDVSATGNLLYVPGPTEGTGTERTIVLATRDGRLTPLATPAGSYVHVRASRDGARLVLDSDDGTEAIVWMYELAGTSAPRRLTFGGRNRFPIWSPDGQRVAFQSDREGDRAIFVQRIDGTGLQRFTTPEKGDEHVPESWAPDGRHLSFAVVKDSTYSLWVLSIDDNKSVPFGNAQSRNPIGSTFAPDGRWIAYHSSSGTESPSNGVFVQPFPAAGTMIRQAPRVAFDFHPVWSPDGAELFYVAIAGGSGGQLAAVRVEPGMTFGSPQRLPGAVAGGRQAGLTRAFDVLPDGRFVGLVSGSAEDISAESASPEIRVVQNWTEELKRLVPTN